MTLTYIYHSCFVISDDETAIIIDYFKDPDDKIHGDFLKRNVKTYVLSTHSHHDHFTPEILDWKNINPNITYVFSKEILDTLNISTDGIVFLDKLETFTDDTLNIRAFGSTDAGGSFQISYKNKDIFHAGDLNNWHWNEESTEEEIVEAESLYNEELNLVANNIRSLDLAMFPIDPRLGHELDKGAKQFLSAIPTKILVPMHFDKNYQGIQVFKDYAEQHDCDYIALSHTNQNINF